MAFKEVVKIRAYMLTCGGCGDPTCKGYFFDQNGMMCIYEDKTAMERHLSKGFVNGLPSNAKIEEVFIRYFKSSNGEDRTDEV